MTIILFGTLNDSVAGWFCSTSPYKRCRETKEKWAGKWKSEVAFSKTHERTGRQALLVPVLRAYHDPRSGGGL